MGGDGCTNISTGTNSTSTVCSVTVPTCSSGLAKAFNAKAPLVEPQMMGRLDLTYACCTHEGLAHGRPKENQDAWVVKVGMPQLIKS